MLRDEFATDIKVLWGSHIMRLARDGSFEDEKSRKFRLGEQSEIYACFPA